MISLLFIAIYMTLIDLAPPQACQAGSRAYHIVAKIFPFGDLTFDPGVCRTPLPRSHKAAAASFLLSSLAKYLKIDTLAKFILLISSRF
jgi:hypothetical protein